MDSTAISSCQRPTWVEIDLQALTSNYQRIRRIVGTSIRVMAVIKANAYGHGAVAVALHLEKQGAACLAVAILEEALQLRDAGVQLPILLLDGFWPGQEELVIRHNLITTVFDPKSVELLNRTAAKMGHKGHYHFKIDTGMSRLGADYETAAETVESCAEFSWVECEGLFTHLSSAEALESTETLRQLERFEKVLNKLKSRGFAIPRIHVANSAAILRWPKSWYDGVRPGLILYGITPFAEEQDLFAPLLTLKTSILQKRRIRKGTHVGYDCSFTANRDTEVAVLPIGYADGYNRLLSNRGTVLLGGQRVPVVGKISMDLTVIDVTEVSQARGGDEVVLIGRQGDQSVGVPELARLCGTIPYEILTGISKRVPRVYRNEAR